MLEAQIASQYEHNTSQVEALKNIKFDNDYKIQFIKDVLNNKIYIFNLDDNKNLSVRIKSFLSTLELDKKNNNSKLTEDSQNKLNEIYEELKNLERIEQISKIKGINKKEKDVIKTYTKSELNILLGLGNNSYDNIKRNIKYFGLLKEIYDALTTPEKSALKEILKDKTIAEASAGDIYALKKEGVNIAKLFLLDNKTGKFIKNTIGNGSELKVYFYKNPNIDKVIGIGDLLDINNISKVSINGRIGTRKSKPRPGYYDKNGRYLVVHGGYRIKILETKKASGGEFNDAIENRYKEIRKKDLQYKIYEKLQTDEKSIKLEGYNENDKKLIKEILSDNKNLKYENDTISSTNSKSLKRNINTMFAKIVPTKSMNEFLSRPGVGEKLNEIYQELGIDINSLMIVIGAESGFNPKAVNPYSGASGLLQFMPSTAKGLGTSVEAIRKMSEVDQLNLVKKYFKAYKGKLHSVVDIYKATFFPVSLKHPEKSWVFRAKGISPEKLAQQNPAIAKYSTRADGFIDGYAFERYVQAHIGSQVSYVNDRKNIVDDYVKNYNENRNVNEGKGILDKKERFGKKSLTLRFKHGQVKSELNRLNINNIKNVKSVFIFKGFDGKDLSSKEIKTITNKLKTINSNLKILIDQEGGIVHRFKDFDNEQQSDLFIKDAIENTGIKNKDAIKNILDNMLSGGNFTSLKKLGDIYNKISESLKQDYLKVITYIRLKTLKDRGINTYGLVTDLNYGNPVSSSRSFGNNEKSYLKFGKAMIDNARKLKMTIYLKHFPGHGAGKVDSHKGVLVYTSKNEVYLNKNIKLFEDLVDYGKGNVGMMIGHIILPKEYKNKFKEVVNKSAYVLTDDLGMNGYKKANIGLRELNKNGEEYFFTTNLVKNKATIVSTKEAKSVV